jgi:uncharacterized protein DUF3224
VLEIDGGGKMTRASVKRTYTGEIEGTSTTEYLMAYRADQSCSFVGLEVITGRIGTRPGSLVLQHGGTYEGAVAKITMIVVPDSGTGALRGLRGQASLDATHQERYVMTLEYEAG